MRTMRVLDNNKTRVAEALGISVRTLRNWLQEWELEGLKVTHNDGNTRRPMPEADEFTDKDLAMFATNKQRLDYYNNPAVKYYFLASGPVSP